MKKILALLLVLLMAAAVVPACADTLEIVPGNPANCQIDDFKTWFDMFTGSNGFVFNWDSIPASEDGYDVYTARPADGDMYVKVYTSGGKVSHLIGEASGTFLITDEEGAEKFGEWFGAVLAGGGMGLLIPEEGINAAQTKAITYETELTPLVEVLTTGFEDADSLSKGVAGSITALGYPTGLEMNGNLSGLSVTIHMKVIITSKDGQLKVVK